MSSPKPTYQKPKQAGSIALTIDPEPQISASIDAVRESMAKAEQMISEAVGAIARIVIPSPAGQVNDLDHAAAATLAGDAVAKAVNTIGASVAGAADGGSVAPAAPPAPPS